MLCIPITGPSLREASHQISQALHLGEMIEFRLDCFNTYDLANLQNLRNEVKKPVIFTLRKKEQGGGYRGSEKERLQEIRRLSTLTPTYFDLEFDISKEFVHEMRESFPGIQIIISCHDFTQTPSDLEAVLKKMQLLPTSLYKMAYHANRTNDALRMLHFVQRHKPILGMCMGEKGEISRILGHSLGTPWVYAALSSGHQTALGQLSAKELRSIYKLQGQKRLYGLIGQPVVNSIGHWTHNRVMERFQLDALYVKMEIEKRDLSDFFSLAKQIGFEGLSVTMPLKEAVIPFLDHLTEDAKNIGSVNTILFKNGRSIGFNTDGKGALDAIEAKIKVEGKKIAILGAGGAARAIIYEALLRGAKVVLFNRTKERALEILKKFGVEEKSLEELSHVDYDILINATSNPLPISVEHIHSHAWVMDLQTYPKMTQLLAESKIKGCRLIFGYEMFIQQAIGQFAIWFNAQIDRSSLQDCLETETRPILSEKKPCF